MGIRAPQGLLVGLGVSVATVLLILFAAEACTRLLASEPLWRFQLLFFSQGAVTEAPWGGYRYEPNRTVRIQLVNITDLTGPRLAKEYDYQLTTNSHGLIQLKEPLQDKPAILLLGDSFTEGQGARPWFYDVESRWPAEAPYQLINGGLFGTGFEYWSRLYRHLSSILTISKAVVIFISDDWRRPLLQLDADIMQCLHSSQSCQPSMPFFGLPDESAEAIMELDRLCRARAEFVKRGGQRKLIERLALYRVLLRPVYLEIRSYIRGASLDEQSFEISKHSLLEIATTLGSDNVILLHLPQRDEIDLGMNAFGLKARDAVRQAGLRLVDGFETCGLAATDYHVGDGHPNADGYRKIAACVERVIADAWPSAAVDRGSAVTAH